MKQLKQIRYLVFAALFGALFLTGCIKDKGGPGTALVGLHLHTYIDSGYVMPGSLQVSFPDSNGRVEHLQYAQFYITNVSFHSTTKGWVPIPNSIVLKREENEAYLVGNIAADTYDDIRFTYGLSDSLDSKSPSPFSASTGADSVLSTAENFMYAGSGNGYAFMKIAGWVDTTAAHSGVTVNSPAFSYTLGGIGDTLVITMPMQTFTLAPLPGEQFIHIICDYGKLLQNLPLTTPAYSTGNSFGNATQQNAAQQMFNAIKNMFRYECYSPTVDC